MLKAVETVIVSQRFVAGPAVKIYGGAGLFRILLHPPAQHIAYTQPVIVRVYSQMVPVFAVHIFRHKPVWHIFFQPETAAGIIIIKSYVK